MNAEPITPGNLRVAVRLALIGLAYYVVHHFGYLSLEPVQHISTIWPASGLALAIVLLNRRRLWPSIFVVIAISNVLSNTINGSSFLAAAGFLIITLLELSVGVWLMSRFRDREVHFARVADVLVLILAATVANACI